MNTNSKVNQKLTPAQRLQKSEKKRHIAQTLFFFATNAHLSGYLSGKIFQGKSKHVCLPGLNCYSCPGALGACPMGSLQSSLYDPSQVFPFYILGLIMLFGVIFGRLICGILCPFGFLQDLLAKIPVKKFRPEEKFPKIDRGLRYLKHVILLVFVIALPLIGRFSFDFMAPWFCKYICPSGTVMAGWPMVALNEKFAILLGWIFSWKTSLAILIIIGSIYIPRIFCRYLCPLGAIYGFFNKFSLHQLGFAESACISCGACKRACPMGVDMPHQHKSPECVRCSRCVAVCPTNCLKSGFGKHATPSPETMSSPKAGA